MIIQAYPSLPELLPLASETVRLSEVCSESGLKLEREVKAGISDPGRLFVILDFPSSVNLLF